MHYLSLGSSLDSDIFSRAKLSLSAIMRAHHRKTRKNEPEIGESQIEVSEV